eukprot:1291262-Ditylum_brightwellii.AAC.1
MGFILCAMILASTLYVDSNKQTGCHLFGFDKSTFLGTGTKVPDFQVLKSRALSQKSRNKS